MIRFNYLRSFTAIAQARNIPRHVQAPLAAIAATLLVVAAAWGIEGYRLSGARTMEAVAQARVERSRAELARTALARADIDSMLALDARLRVIRRSGSTLAQRLADIANHVPDHTSLSSIVGSGGGISISGHAQSLRAISDTISSFMAARTVADPALVRMQRDDLSGTAAVLSFEMRVEERP
ncbi:MAG: PilN domain-containing protein [Candidatus Eremiobacteraeota bacterium]|nr:PilN domain-containing protein [Candidatus Eremiobacteraeota bacterium]